MQKNYAVIYQNYVTAIEFLEEGVLRHIRSVE